MILRDHQSLRLLAAAYREYVDMQMVCWPC